MYLAKALTIAIIASSCYASQVNSECGIASVYWEGTTTANGEHFYPRGISAAHKSLPFGTRVAVRDQRSGRSIMVRINDRGPFIAGRIIDLSRGAALALGVDGLAPVCIETMMAGYDLKQPPLSQRIQHNTGKHVKVCKKRRHVVRKKKKRCTKRGTSQQSFKSKSRPLHASADTHIQKEEKPVIHELLGAAALVSFLSPTISEQPRPAPIRHPLQMVVDMRFEKKLESLEDKMDRIMKKLDTPAPAPAPAPKIEELPSNPITKIDHALQHRIDTLTKKANIIKVEEPTDSGLPPAPPPNQEEPRANTTNPITTNPPAVPSRLPPVADTAKPTEDMSFTQKLVMQKLVKQLDQIEERLARLETQPKAVEPPPALPRAEKPRNARIPPEVEQRIQGAPAGMQADLRRRYREHMKKPCYFTDDDGERIPCTMRSLIK